MELGLNAALPSLPLETHYTQTSAATIHINIPARLDQSHSISPAKQMCLSSAEEGLEVISNRAVVVQALSSSCQGPVLQLGHIQSQWEQEELLGRDKDRLAGTAVPAVLDLSLWHKEEEEEVRGM